VTLWYAAALLDKDHIPFGRHPHRGRITPVNQCGEFRPRGLDREKGPGWAGWKAAALECPRSHARALCANSSTA
jgi:hypothetical protein